MNIFILKSRHFHLSQLEIFSCIDQINFRRITKENERKVDKCIKILNDNFFELQTIQNISEYTMLSSYYVRYPKVQEMNEFYLKSRKEERL